MTAIATRKQRLKLRPKRCTSFSSNEVKSMCRFEKDDLSTLRKALGLPDTMAIGAECYRISGDDALFLTLRRLSYPCRLRDLSAELGLSKTKVSVVFNAIVDAVYDKWRHLLRFHDSRFNPANLRRFAECCRARGCPIQRCVGFIDGTCRPICRPKRHQKLLFSGHKRVHALKFQSLVTPDGLVSHLGGPYCGNRHDSAILTMSGLLADMRRSLRDEDGPFVVYGDSGYPIASHIVCPYKGARLSEGQVRFNLAMSKIRISVEWAFGEILQQFSFVDYKKNQKLLLQPIAKQYVACAILSNCRTCLYGNAVSALFRCIPPTLNEYLTN